MLTISSCLKGDGTEEHPPKKLLTTTVATMQDCHVFGKLARLEAERRGIRNAQEVIIIGDGGNWIDAICDQSFASHQRIIDYYRARGWPIGSGLTESGVKRFGKRVKGAEQFWNVKGAEAILALRSLWLSEDEQSQHYWLGYLPRKAAA